MPVRAEWHIPVVAADLDDDPFAAPIEDVGVPIRLTGNAAELAAELVDLVHTEKRLRNHGVRCEIRDLPDTSCSACPIAGAVPALCPVGQRQERLVTRLAVMEAQHG